MDGLILEGKDDAKGNKVGGSILTLCMFFCFCVLSTTMTKLQTNTQSTQAQIQANIQLYRSNKPKTSRAANSPNTHTAIPKHQAQKVQRQKIQTNPTIPKRVKKNPNQKPPGPFRLPKNPPSDRCTSACSSATAARAGRPWPASRRWCDCQRVAKC